ncbi:MAG: hypothetical protein K6T75_09505 [Acetobacteraceae bacterium]|nr:hypothetical protein [Acetobacteraceae bacterium]
MTWLDWVCVGVLSAGALSGFFGGFWRSCLRVAAFFAAVFLAGLVWRSLLALVQRWEVVGRVTPAIARGLGDALGSGAVGPGWAEVLGVPGPLAGVVEARVPAWLPPGGEPDAAALGLGLAHLICAAVVALVMYGVMRCLVELVVGLLGRRVTGGLLLRPLGAVLGVADSALWLMLVVALLAPLLALPSAGPVNGALLKARWGGHLMEWSAALWRLVLGRWGLP